VSATLPETARVPAERPPLRVVGPLTALSTGDLRALLERTADEDARVRDTAAAIVARVRTEGDAALRALAYRLDGVELAEIEVPTATVRAALDALPMPLRRALERAASNIAAVHRAARPLPVEIETEPGVRVGRRPDPLPRVGVYAPGGRAAYPSSVLMGAVPARVAGVGEVVLCSPPGADGRPSAVVLAAAALAGVDRVFAVGGAGAIAAMAYGTGTVLRVDRVIGPGNAYVAAAKRLVAAAGAVGTDAPAGPSEVLVVADESADPAALAREIVAQAEHDPDACALVVFIGDESAVRRAIESAASGTPRRAIVAAALATRGGVLRADSLEAALAFAADYAPEHLLLAVADPEAALARVRNAGTVFLGLSSSVAFGDYLTGANHVLPTGASARFGSGLSPLDFVRWTTWQRVTPAGAARLAADTALLATAEGLPGHAAAASAWGAL
jgi:histidinol dehydrogenase